LRTEWARVSRLKRPEQQIMTASRERSAARRNSTAPRARIPETEADASFRLLPLCLNRAVPSQLSLQWALALSLMNPDDGRIVVRANASRRFKALAASRDSRPLLASGHRFQFVHAAPMRPCFDVNCCERKWAPSGISLLSDCVQPSDWGRQSIAPRGQLH
jgi:hypothetical protein